MGNFKLEIFLCYWSQGLMASDVI